MRQAFKELVLKVLSAEFAPIAEVFDQNEDAMTTRDRLKKWYDEEASRFRAEGMEKGKDAGIKEGIQKGLTEGQRSPARQAAAA